jgi:hypothetical protein
LNEDTALTPKHVLLEEILVATIDVLRRMPPSAQTRALLSEAERYRRTVGEWASRAPSSLQRATMFDCVVALRAKVTPLSPPSEPPPASFDAPRIRRRA